MEATFSELKCDYCTYRDTTVTFDQYKDSIGRPCPECGNSLLTQEEYDKCLRIVQYANAIGKIGNVLKWINPFHYIRLIFGIKPKVYNIEVELPKRKV